MEIPGGAVCKGRGQSPGHCGADGVLEGRFGKRRGPPPCMGGGHASWHWGTVCTQVLIPLMSSCGLDRLPDVFCLPLFICDMGTVCGLKETLCVKWQHWPGA